MKRNDSELIAFLERAFTFRKLPLLSISSKTVRELDLSEGQVMALAKIVFAPKETFVSTIAEQMFMSTPKASRLIESLVEANLVKRVYDTLNDRRKIQLTPTQEGVATFEQITNEVIHTVGELLADVGDTSRELSINLDVFNERLLSRMKDVET